METAPEPAGLCTACEESRAEMREDPTALSLEALNTSLDLVILYALLTPFVEHFSFKLKLWAEALTLQQNRNTHLLPCGKGNLPNVLCFHLLLSL